MDPEHILLCYRSSRAGDAALLKAAQLARGAAARLTVLVPLAGVAASPRCCGIQGRQWQLLVRHALRDELDSAAVLLGERRDVEFALGEGSTIPVAIADYAVRARCDLIAVPAAAPGFRGAFSRKVRRELEQLAPCDVIRLGATGDGDVPARHVA